MDTKIDLLAVSKGLDTLSHWLQSDPYLGYAVIFSLIFVTTFRKCVLRFFIQSGLNPITSSSRPSVFHTRYTIWLYVWPLDRCYNLLFRVPPWSARCILAISYLLPPTNSAVAFMHNYGPTGGQGHREASSASLPHSSRTLPVQRHELPSCCIAKPYVPDLYPLHRLVALQADHSHEHRQFDTLVRKLPRGEAGRRAGAGRELAGAIFDYRRHFPMRCNLPLYLVRYPQGGE